MQTCDAHFTTHKNFSCIGQQNQKLPTLCHQNGTFVMRVVRHFSGSFAKSVMLELPCQTFCVMQKQHDSFFSDPDIFAFDNGYAEARRALPPVRSESDGGTNRSYFISIFRRSPRTWPNTTFEAGDVYGPADLPCERTTA